MPEATDVYVHCDVLDNLPAPNKDNWMFEVHFLCSELPKSASVLQVGSMDGTRAIELLGRRPDLKITGIEIEKEFVLEAEKNVAHAGLYAKFVHGDITCPPELEMFDYVVCLNNTLGYIPDDEAAMKNMKKLGKKVIVSVYGERFTDALAEEYFASIHLPLIHIEKNVFLFDNFTRVKRYTREEVELWCGEIVETPIGYCCVIAQN